MSSLLTQTEQRAQLVAELDGVNVTTPGGATIILSATPTVPRTISPYTTWPEWIATRPTGMCAWEIDWHVLVALPGSDAQSYVAAGDQLIDAVMVALNEYEVTRVEPVLLAVADSADMPALRFTFTI